jgi:hypothetical protein
MMVCLRSIPLLTSYIGAIPIVTGSAWGIFRFGRTRSEPGASGRCAERR